MENTYYLGLDMGSGSLGYSVTDPEYHILKKTWKITLGRKTF